MFQLPVLRLRALSTCLAVLLFLSGCEKPTVGVSLHGVNYSADTFSYAVSAIEDPESATGGGLVDPFGGGGMTCCVELPRQWRPGIKLKVRTTHWVEKRAENSIKEFQGEHIVEVPQYLDGKPGELWVLREADGKVSVISSDFQPDHPKWPGKVKGWPVPSLEYQRERWEIVRHHEEGGVRLYSSFLERLAKAPEKEAKEAWEYAKEHEPHSLKSFTGPDDPAYLEALRLEYQEGLERSNLRLKEVMGMRP